ncbi:MAG: polysaccharide biosynthesis C-terminal domain-containing protein, partial [Bacillota bacterium]
TLGQQRTAARNQIICYGVQIAFTWFAIPQYALAGYAAGFLCMQALNFFLDFIAMRRALGWQPKLLNALTPIFLAAILMALLIKLVFRLLSDSSISVLPAFVFC